jgi:8-oxo-dGTP pyrophosphatase MutT (NUDIX family)
VTDEPTRWTIRSERVVDDTRRLRLNVAEVELPDGVVFEQYVLRMPKAAMMAVVNDHDEVLMMWRHRWIIDRWVWELPGGYVDATDSDPAGAAIREVEEETGWRPTNLAPLLAFQPMVGLADAENLLFVGRGAEYIGTPKDINEAARVSWIPLGSVPDKMRAGEIVGAGSLIALFHLLSMRG